MVMLKYPSVALLGLAWCAGVAMPDIGISNIVPIAFGQVYGWGPGSQGLSNAGFLVGCIIGEAFAGSVSDWVRRQEIPEIAFADMSFVVDPLSYKEERWRLRS